MNRKQYEEDLARRQKEHLDSIRNHQQANWQPCLHDACQECVGTGIKKDGTMCVHMISCPCPKCSPRCISLTTTTPDESSNLPGNPDQCFYTS